MNVKIFCLLVVTWLIQSCTNLPAKYKDDCAGDACKHMVNRCVQIKASSSLQTQYGVTPIKNYEGPALVDGMWSVKCKNGKVVQIMDSKFKDISLY